MRGPPGWSTQAGSRAGEDIRQLARETGKEAFVAQIEADGFFCAGDEHAAGIDDLNVTVSGICAVDPGSAGAVTEKQGRDQVALIAGGMKRQRTDFYRDAKGGRPRVGAEVVGGPGKGDNA